MFCEITCRKRTKISLERSEDVWNMVYKTWGILRTYIVQARPKIQAEPLPSELYTFLTLIEFAECGCPARGRSACCEVAPRGGGGIEAESAICPQIQIRLGASFEAYQLKMKISQSCNRTLASRDV